MSHVAVVNPSARRRPAPVVGAAAVGVLLVVGVAFFSYKAAALLVGGAAAAAGARSLVRRLERLVRRIPRLAWGPTLGRARGVLSALAAIVVFLTTLLALLNGRSDAPRVVRPPSPVEPEPQPQVRAVDVVLTPAGGDAFTVQLSAVVRDLRRRERVVNLGQTTLAASSAGLLLREVTIPPPKLDGYDIAAGASYRVALRDMPHGSFYEARDATTVTRSRYLDTDVVRWTVPTLESGVVFAYTPERWIFVRRLLSPAGWLASLQHWIALIVGGAFALIVWPVALELARGRLRTRLQRARA
jgi:hypothetical protein